jgi:hypothetical protein
MGMLLVLGRAVKYGSNITRLVERDQGTALRNELDSSLEERFLVFFQKLLLPLKV